MGRGERTVDVPVGIERVLYLAAVEPDFRARLMADREAALTGRGLRIRTSERALLMAVPDEMLANNIDGVDTSPRNLERRSFLQAVAASAAVVASAGGAQGCGDAEKVPLDSGVGDRGARPDMGADTLPLKEQGVMKDAGIPPDTIPADMPPWTADGIFPDMPPPDTVPLKSDRPNLPDTGILPDMPKPDGA